MDLFERLRRRLHEKASDVGARAVTYVAIGDSVTQGCMEADVLEYEHVYPYVIRRHMERHYPGTIVNVINSGVGGDTITASRTRWERDLFMYKPDLVTICFGHNDAWNLQAGLPAFIKTTGELVERIRQETEADVLLMTPCMMMKRDNGRIAKVHQPHISGFIKLAEDGVLQLYIDAIRQLAVEQHIPLFDSYSMWEQMEREGVDIHDLLSNGINHPNPNFHVLWGDALYKRLCLKAKQIGEEGQN